MLLENVYTTFQFFDRISNSYIDICLIFSFLMKNTINYSIFIKKGQKSNWQLQWVSQSLGRARKKTLWIHRTIVYKITKLLQKMLQSWTFREKDGIRNTANLTGRSPNKCCNYLSQWWVGFKFELTWDCLHLSFLIKCYLIYES